MELYPENNTWNKYLKPWTEANPENWKLFYGDKIPYLDYDALK